ncbi:MAG TPA: DMT family transporter [Chryseosolibacter sp.]
MTEVRRSYFIAGVLFCILGAVCFSTKAIFVKLAYRDTTVDAVTLLALRMVFSLPFFLVSAAISSSQSDNKKFTPKQWIYIALIGSLGYYASSLLDFLGLQYVSAGIERLILFIYPTLVLIFSSLIFGDKIKKIQWIAVAVTYAGLVLAFVGEANISGEQKDFYLGSALIFACAITFALYIVGSGKLIPIVGASKYNSYAMTFACLSVLAHFFITSEQSLFNLDRQVYIYSIAMALLGTVIPSYLVTEGIKRVGSDNAAIIGSVGPVSTIIQANIFLNEPVLAVQIAGTALILAGVFIISRGKNAKSLKQKA